MGSGKKKIEITKITKQSSRMVTFSKRRKGLFKKASELGSKTGADVAMVVFSPAGKPYTWGDVSSVSKAVLDYDLSPDASANADAAALPESSNSKAAAADLHASAWMGIHRQLLDTVDVEAPYNLDQLYLLKNQLEYFRDVLGRVAK